MKVIYAAPYLHETPVRDTDLLREEWDRPAAEELRKAFEEELGLAVAGLKPKKVFLEGRPKGLDVTSDMIQYAQNLTRIGSGLDPLQRILGNVAKEEGTTLEGMDHPGWHRIHGFLIRKGARFDFLFRSAARRFLLSNPSASWPTLRGLAVLFVARGFIASWHFFVFMPLNALCTNARDFHMGRWIRKSALDGINIAIYGAAHKPMRFVGVTGMEKLALRDMRHVRRQLDAIEALHSARDREELTVILGKIDLPEVVKSRMKRPAGL